LVFRTYQMSRKSKNNRIDFDDDDFPLSGFEDDFEIDDISFPEESNAPDEKDKLKEFVSSIPLFSPLVISDELEKLGYKGQEEQRRALSLMAYRHVRRLKRLYVDDEERRSLPPKQNILMIGPTGCGKTFLVELLFQNIFKLPTVIIDITSYTESGYVGDSVHTILTRLIDAASRDSLIAQCGVICLDEFDKIASSGSSARFAGQGTTKDVAGYGVQRELLAMIEGTEIVAPMDYGFSEFGYRSHISTRDIPFICCGAFSGFDELLGEKNKNIGYRNLTNNGDGSQLTLDEVASFQKFGFLPELIGRFSRIVTFQALPESTLKRILTENILPRFQNEFRGEGLKLTVTEDALNHIVSRSKKRGTGARGLNIELMTVVEKAAFETFMQIREKEVIVTTKDGNLTSEIV